MDGSAPLVLPKMNRPSREIRRVLPRYLCESRSACHCSKRWGGAVEGTAGSKSDNLQSPPEREGTLSSELGDRNSRGGTIAPDWMCLSVLLWIS